MATLVGNTDLHLAIPALKVGKRRVRSIAKSSQECCYHQPHLLWGSDSFELWPGSIENTSGEKSHSAILQRANRASSHSLLCGKVVIVLLDKAHGK